MGAEVKFCGLTRRVDAQLGARLGARYLGVIFAGGPRQQTVESAVDLYVGCAASVRRVGVFGSQSVAEIVAIADQVGLDVLQLHGDPDPELLAAMRSATNRELWSVVRTSTATLPPAAAELFEVSDGVVLDARVEGALGGTGVALDWSALADTIRARRGSARLILAGGLTPANVARAITLIGPDVVDVSSGVEASPGVKSPVAMRNFMQAVVQTPVAS